MANPDTEEEVEATSPEETVPEVPATENLADKVEELVEKALDKLLPEKEAKAGKRPTYRDEEASMADQVSKAVKQLLDEEKATAEKHPEPKADKREPELVPAQPPGRRVEHLMGWS